MRVCPIGQPAVVLPNFRFKLAPDFIDLPALMGIQAKLILRSRCSESIGVDGQPNLLSQQLILSRRQEILNCRLGTFLFRLSVRWGGIAEEGLGNLLHALQLFGGDLMPFG